MALNLPNIVVHVVPLLKRQQNYSITMSQNQAICLLTHALASSAHIPGVIQFNVLQNMELTLLFTSTLYILVQNPGLIISKLKN